MEEKKHLECERRKLPESFEAYAAFRYDIGTFCFSRRCFPVFGRSITYRTGVLQPLALLSLRGWLPKELPAGQVRAAMTAVIQRMSGDNRNFNAEGYLTLGFNGSQPNISDWYTNNGSLYLASLAFLPLGLAADDPFWTDAPQPWTSKKAWGGEDFPKRSRILRIIIMNKRILFSF